MWINLNSYMAKDSNEVMLIYMWYNWLLVVVAPSSTVSRPHPSMRLFVCPFSGSFGWLCSLIFSPPLYTWRQMTEDHRGFELWASQLFKASFPHIYYLVPALTPIRLVINVSVVVSIRFFTAIRQYFWVSRPHPLMRLLNARSRGRID